MIIRLKKLDRNVQLFFCKNVRGGEHGNNENQNESEE
jgi:hypothetical protein